VAGPWLAEMQRTLGTAVFSGMIGVTLFGIFLTLVFFFVINWFTSSRVVQKELDEAVDLNGQVHGPEERFQGAHS
jgi:multidrug efflux pump